MERKRYIVIYTKKNDNLMRSMCVEGYDRNDAEDAFDALTGGGEPVNKISITENTSELTNNEIDLCVNLLDSIRLHSYWNDVTGKYELDGSVMSVVLGKNRMESLIHAIGKIANLKK
jgi:hypothetical protein